MAVAHSSASESHTGTIGSTNQTAFSWTHTQTGTPQGVLVFVHVANSTLNPVGTVTYGSVTLTQVEGGAAVDGAGEAGRTDLFFAGSGLPSGNQTITVNRTSNAAIMYASAATVTAATNTNVTGIVLLEGDGTMAEQSVTDGSPGTNSLRYAAAYSGLNAPPTTGANSTLLTSIDFGNYTAAMVRETTAGQGARSVGFTTASDDRAAVHVAVRERFNRTDNAVVGAFTLTGNDATLTKAAAPKVMDGGTGAFTLTGQPADLLHNANVDGGTGAFALTGQSADLKIGHAIAGDVGKFFLPERNLARYSEQFDNAYWVKNKIGTALAPVVTANAAVAPDGTLTADRVVFDTNGSTTTNDRSDLETPASTSTVIRKTYIFSVWLKTTDGSSITIQLSHSAPSPTYPTVTGSWQRFTSLSNVAADTIRRPRLSLRVGTPTSAYASLHVWGFQWEEGTSITDYDPTGPANATDAALRQAYRLDGGTGAFTLAGQPADTRHNVRIEGGTGAFAFTGNDATLTEAAASKVLTAETGAFTLTGNPVSTLVAVQLGGDVGKFFLPERNVLLRSEEFNQAVWGRLGTNVFANQITAPDGTLTADRLIENSANSEHFAEEALPVVTGNRYVLSCYAKGDGSGRSLVLRTALQGIASVSFNLANGTGSVNASNNLVSYGSTALANSWYRCWIVFDAIGTGTAVFRLQLYDNLGSFIYTGNGTASAYIWGAQLEQASAVSDYDPTGPAGATDAALRQQYKLAAEVGVFAHTGQPATLAKGRTITAETGTFTAAGQPATLLHKPRIEANTGSFALSGGAPALLRGWYLSGGAGEFIETGQPATFRRTWAVQAATGAFSFTGNPAALTELGAYEIDPIVGSFTLSDQPANLAQSQSLLITVGAFVFTGQPATLRQDQALAAEAGSFVVAGQPASLKRGYRISADAGAFSLSGQATGLITNSALAVDRGQFALTGQSATFAKIFEINAESASYALTGNNANLFTGSKLDAGLGIFALAGSPVSFVKFAPPKEIQADRGVFALAGNSAELQFSQKLSVDAGDIFLSGNAAALKKNINLYGSSGQFALTGGQIQSVTAETINVASGLFVFTGSPVAINYQQRRKVVIIF